MTSLKARKYCSVYGCLNTNSRNPELSFFQIPIEEEVRLKWLKIIDRQDLSHISTRHIFVCQAHFRAEDVSMTSSRKVLRKKSLPSLYLPLTKDRVNPTSVSISTQTDIPTCSVSCQTMKISTSENITGPSTSLSADTPSKVKLERLWASDEENEDSRLSDAPSTPPAKRQCLTPNFIQMPESMIDDPETVQMTEEDYETLGKSIGIQLRDLSKTQLTITQKIISDAIYYARMDMLTEKSHIALQKDEPNPETSSGSITYEFEPYSKIKESP
ncbi:uncharacterized protein [Epargyreus clarus]|uniref:uncharacterized protein isoform X1 n=1 Tax=Epargyreus clarus TaxID=520877 RepID=UPI003C2BA903